MIRFALIGSEALMAAAAMVYLLYVFVLSHVEGDQAFLLYAARQVLAGVRLDGPQLIETNPPLIVWFSTIPAGLAGLFHIDPVTTLRIVVLVLFAVSAYSSARILARSRIAEHLGRRTVQWLWGTSYFLVLMIHPAEFGQREQLLLLFFLPYVFAAGLGAAEDLSTVSRMGLGCAAGLGLCFKPHHVLSVACLEIFLLLYQRSARRLLSPELLLVTATGLLYVVAVRVFTPDYIKVVLPLLGSTYWALGQYSFSAMAIHVGQWLTLSAFVGAVLWRVLRRTLACAQLEGALLASATGAMLAHFVQGTGWYHQAIPAAALFQIAAIWLLLDWVRVSPPQHASGNIWAGAAVCGVLAFCAVFFSKHHASTDKHSLSAELAQYPAGTAVYVFTISLSHFPVVLDHRLVWGSRYAHLWMLPAIAKNEPTVQGNIAPSRRLPQARVTQLSALLRENVTQDIQRTRPAVVYVEQCDRKMCDGLTFPMAFIPWFCRSPEFARVWSGYQLERTISGYDIYTRRAP